MVLCGVGNGLRSPLLWWTLARHWPVSLQSQWEDGTWGEETQGLGLRQPLVPFILALQSPVVLELRRKWVWWSWAHGHVCRPREGHRKSQEAQAWGKDPSVSILIVKWWSCSGKVLVHECDTRRNSKDVAMPSPRRCRKTWPCWLVFINLTQSGVTWEMGTSMEEYSPSAWHMVLFVGGISLINDGCRRGYYCGQCHP